MRSIYRFLIPVIGAVVLSCGLQAVEKRGITAEDYFSFRFLADPHLSPDGKQCVYVLTTIDQKRNRRDSSIWVVSVDGSAPPRRLSAEGFSSSSPRWSPDGKTLAFLSSRNVDGATEPPHPQVFLMSMSGGEALPLTKLKNGVSLFQWSPDGTRLVCVGRSGDRKSVV